MIKNKGTHLAWVVVEDFAKAVRFYTDVVGLQVKQLNEEYGWAELSGEEGTLLGIAKKSDTSEIQPGQNAVMTFNVADMANARQELMKRGTKIIGDVVEVPGHVRMQTFCDPDGNTLQLVQTLEG